MEEKVNIRRAVLALVLVFNCCGLLTAVAQDDRRDNQQERRDQNRDESRYDTNSNYKKGWKDGQKHKHKNKKFKNDSDREAYEAGYGHGDHGERWQNPNQRRDHDNPR
jgi:hypothetical protein